MNQETIKCARCGQEVIKRSENHTLCMPCAYKHVEQEVKKLWNLDMRNMGILETMHDDEETK